MGRDEESSEGDSSDALEELKRPGWFRVECGKNPALQEMEKRLFSRRQDELADRVFSLKFGNVLNESDIKELYRGNRLEEHMDAVVLVLKLIPALLAYGHNTIDATELAQGVCDALKLTVNQLNLGTRLSVVSFGTGPTHSLTTYGGTVLDKMSSVTKLCMFIQNSSDLDVRNVIHVLDDIIDGPSPYGPGAEFIGYYGLTVMAAFAAFMGSWHDAVAVAIIAPFVCGTTLLPQVLPCIAYVDFILPPIAVGVLTPLVWRYIFPWTTACHVLVWVLSLILVFLPGGELLNGAYEIMRGSPINGASRLTNSLVKAIILTIGVTIGWQLFGHNILAELGSPASLQPSGPAASLPPAKECSNFAYPWWVVFCIINFPMMFFAFLGLNVRLRDMPGIFCVVYPSLIIFMALNMCGETSTGSHDIDHLMCPELPTVVKDGLAIFIAGNLALLHEYLTGVPAYVAISPIIVVLAPGSKIVLSVISFLHYQEAHVTEVVSFWGSLALQGTSYMVGYVLAFGLWRPLMRRKHRKVVDRAALLWRNF